jgi:hypothetical protein
VELGSYYATVDGGSTAAGVDGGSTAAGYMVKDANGVRVEGSFAGAQLRHRKWHTTASPHSGTTAPPHSGTY